MPDPIRIGIIICDRYRTCAGGKCLRQMYFQTHMDLGTWRAAEYHALLELTLYDEPTRLAYD